MIDFLGARDGLPEDVFVEDGAYDEAARDALHVPLVAATQVVKHRDFGLVCEVTC